MGGKPSPRNLGRQAETIEQIGFVVGNAAGQNLRFPRRRRNLIPLQLLDDLQQAIDAVQTARQHGMLPAQQETHEILRGDRARLRCGVRDHYCKHLRLIEDTQDMLTGPAIEVVIIRRAVTNLR